MSETEDEHDPLVPLVARMIKELGEDPGRDGLERTPLRVAKSMRFMTRGYDQDPVEILNNALIKSLKKMRWDIYRILKEYKRRHSA